MEDAEPKVYETKESNNDINFIEEIKIKKENEEYKMQLGIKENNLVIKVLPENLLDMIYFQRFFTLNELINISQIFSAYKDVKDIIKVLKDLKFDIEEQIDDIIVKFNVFMPNGKIILIELNLKKHLVDNKDMIKYLLKEIILIKNDMKNQKEIYNEERVKNDSEIKDLNEKISKAETKISSLQLDNMNYKTEISNLKIENKKLWEEINQKQIKEPKNNKQKLFQTSIAHVKGNNFGKTKSEEIIISKKLLEENLDDFKPKEINYKFEILEKNPEIFNHTFNNKNENVKFEFTIVNKSTKAFPGNGKTRLITDKVNSNIYLKDIILNEIKPGEKEKIIVYVNLYTIDTRKNKINLVLVIDGKIIGNPITLTLFDISLIRDFRQEFNLDNQIIDDVKLLSLLQKHNFNYINTFAALFSYEED